jgi:hypothetical protein
LCDEDEEPISGMLNEELKIDSDDEMHLETEVETANKELSNKMSESERVKQVLLHVLEWEDVIMGNKKP